MDASAILALAKSATTGSAAPLGVLEDRHAAFEKIYSQRLWGKGESASGPGSSRINAVGAIGAVASVLSRTEARTMLDIGCGDLNWLGEAVGGGAIQVDAVDITRAACKTPPENIKFGVLDIVSTVPRRAYDVVLCRQCLNHMQAVDALAALTNIRASASCWLLATTYPKQLDNALLPGAEAGVTYRPYNLSAPPFAEALGDPEQLFEDEYDEVEKERNPMVLGLWRLAPKE